MIRFRERMVGTVGPVPRHPWVLRPRGPGAADGIEQASSSTSGARPALLELAHLHVHVTDVDPERDGYRAVLGPGTVSGVGPVPLPVDCGFADLLTADSGGRRMHYRLLVTHRDRPAVVDGVKVVRGGVRTAWAATTTLHTIVVRVRPDALPPDPDDRPRWLAAGGIPGEVVAGGVLRVRGLVRQGLSLRGDVAGFVAGFVTRTVRPPT